jgi:phosphoribosylaminoimidazolecarboxamide formyltransferase/IMP cyclohydrolase
MEKLKDGIQIRRALVSVSDKTALIPNIRVLVEKFGVEIISTGGTAKALIDAGIPVTQIDEFTGFPEILDGRVKTLHPAVHGGILFRRDNPAHRLAVKEHNIEDIDLVIVNLYPFEQTVARPECTIEQAIENIDIGGPSMLRSAAKNHEFVTVISSPKDYEELLAEMDQHDGSTTLLFRREMANKVFSLTSAYDAAISQYLVRDLNDLVHT